MDILLYNPRIEELLRGITRGIVDVVRLRVVVVCSKGREEM